jgi:hypothetical protein
MEGEEIQFSLERGAFGPQYKSTGGLDIFVPLKRLMALLLRVQKVLT